MNNAQNSQPKRYKAKAGNNADSGVAEKQMEEKFGKPRTCKLLTPRHVS